MIRCQYARMTPNILNCYLALFVFALSSPSVWSAENLTCYQCQRNAIEECGVESLQVCPPNKDRCVTQITKDPANGLLLKRECGLGPCTFGDDMANKGLGLSGCDRSKDEYFCVFCCRGNGCNKDSSSTITPAQWLINLAILPAVLNTLAIIYHSICDAWKLYYCSYTAI